MENLEWCPRLAEIYLTGNPCTDWPKYRQYVVAKCDSLVRLDGEDVTKSERLKAKTNLNQLEAELEKLSAKEIAKKEFEKKEGIHDPNKYNAENRWQWYLEEQARKEKSEQDRKDNSI